MRPLRAGRFESRLIVRCLGYDSKTIESAQYRDESLAHLGRFHRHQDGSLGLLASR
jgi:hypothetical protein